MWQVLMKLFSLYLWTLFDARTWLDTHIIHNLPSLSIVGYLRKNKDRHKEKNLACGKWRSYYQIHILTQYWLFESLACVYEEKTIINAHPYIFLMKGTCSRFETCLTPWQPLLQSFCDGTFSGTIIQCTSRRRCPDKSCTPAYCQCSWSWQ